jgi:DNA-directed RNA polymerase II subunit RPB2
MNSSTVSPSDSGIVENPFIWKVIESYFKEKGLVRHQIETFDKFINDIQNIISREPPIETIKEDEKKVKSKHTVEFGDVYIAPPCVIEADRTIRTVYPSDARNRNITYNSAIYVDVKETYEVNGEVEYIRNHKRVIIGRTPIMLRSSLCNLSDCTPGERIKNGECESDPGGYFIIKGNERTLVGQLRGVYNQVIVLAQKPSDKYKYVADIRSMSEETGHSTLVQAKIGNNDKTIVFCFQYIKEPLPVGIVFKALGYTSDEQIKDLIGMKGKLVEPYLKIITRDSFFIKTREEALCYIGQFSAHTIKEDKRIDYAKQIVENELFPHMGITASIKSKALLLGHILNKLLSTYLGFRTPDDRDNYIFKRVEMSGVLCSGLFRTLFKRYIKSIGFQLEKKKHNLDVMTTISRNNGITTGLQHSFATGTWGLPKNAYSKTGVSQVLDRYSYFGTISQLRRMVIPVGKEGKNTKIRQINQSQIMFVCPAETPEGISAGIVLNLALLTGVSSRVDTVLMKEVLYKSKILIYIDDFEGGEGYVKVFLNGILLGVVVDGDDFVEEVRTFRECGMFDKSVSITYYETDEEVIILSDEGRLIRPVFTVKDKKLVIKESDGTSWTDLVNKNCIKYLDNSEVENSVIAMTQNDLEKYDNDYCEIHPSMMLGVMGSTIPFPDHSQAPRNCYQSSMGKQAMGMVALSHNIRTDTILHILDYPQKPIVYTLPSAFIGCNDMPSGINAIVAVMCYGGFNQEDSILLNGGSIDRGLFVSHSFRTVVCETKKRASNTTETICIPPLDKRRKDANYGLLDKNGIIKKGVPVKEGYVIVGKVLTTTNKSNDKEETVDCSLIVKSGEDGIVDRIFDQITPSGYRLIKVVIRKLRIPEIGDKFASRAAQKGTVGMIYNQEDMPFTKDGITPDIIMNTHALPSRMTVNQLMECALGKACALDGTYGDATAFNNNGKDIMEDVCKRLKDKGFERHGWEQMYSGFTGEPLDAQVFIGPTYYQRLKHNVSDKIHCLSILGTTVLTKSGWKNAYEITKDDEIATLKKGLLIYEKPTNIMIYENHIGDMYYIKNKDIELYVTGNHRMWASELCGKKWLSYDFHRADKLIGKSVKYKKNAKWLVSDYKFILPNHRRVWNNDVNIQICDKYLHMDSWLVFLGIWYNLKGWVDNYETQGNINLEVKKLRNSEIKDLLIALTKLGYCYNRQGNKISVRDIQLYAYMKSLTHEELPNWVFELSQKQVRLLIKNMLLRNTVFTTHSKILAEQFQRLLLHAGFAGTIYINPKNHRKLDVSIVLKYPGMNYIHKDIEYEEEKLEKNVKCSVFCLEVPSEVFYVKRNGKCVWTGNSRASGHVTTLTRQPLEGRSRKGGLRFGEMERDSVISHGASRFLKGRLFDQSDPYQAVICEKCGDFSTTPTWCKGCDTDKVSKINLPYAAKLLFQELNAMGIKIDIRAKK